jgi:hypothetical protein
MNWSLLGSDWESASQIKQKFLASGLHHAQRLSIGEVNFPKNIEPELKLYCLFKYLHVIF